MTRFLSLAVVLPWFAIDAVAAPAAKGPAPTPITAANVSRLRPVTEVPKAVYRIVRGPTRGTLIFYDYKTIAEVVDEGTLKVVRPLGKDLKPSDVAVSPDGKFLAWCVGNAKSYTVQEAAGGKTFEIEIGDHPGYAAFSPDGTLLAIGYTFWAPAAEGVGHSEMRLYDLKGKLVRTLEKNGPGSLHPRFSPDGKTLAVGNRNHETQLFDVATGKLLHKLDKRMTQDVQFSPDGKTLAAGYVDGTVGLWDVATGKNLHTTASGCQEIYSVDWGPKGDVLATSGRDGKVVLWKPADLTKLHELDAGFWVIQVRFTADGARLLTASAADYGGQKDRKVVAWAVPNDDR